MEHLPSSNETLEVSRGIQATSSVEAEAIQSVIQKIVEQVQHEPAENKIGASKEVVLEIEVNGFQFTVTRSGKVILEEHNALSPREKEIVRLIANGLPNKAIATVLDISQWTVASHLRRIYAKLGVKSRAEMVAQVLGQGMLKEPGFGE
jgi:DNA-binding CsgD family transcriptional regulator